MKDYYQILGLHSAANAVEIKRAYRRLAVLYHPDKNPAPAAEQFFKEVNEAYDVLGNEPKRRRYDYLRFHQFTENIQESKRPYHRDPAYRREKRPFSPPREARPTSLELMKEYLPYFKWLNWAGLAIMILFAVDYSLPVRTSKEQIVEMYRVASARSSYEYDMLITATGKKIRVYNYEANYFFDHREIIIDYTPLWHVVLNVSTISKTHSIYVGGIYNPIFSIPCMLFFISFMGILFRKDVEYAFNFSMGSGILIILVIYLIFTT